MIVYQDFLPQHFEPPRTEEAKRGFLSSVVESVAGPSVAPPGDLPRWERFDEVVQRANAWAAAQAVRVLSFETVVMPAGRASTDTIVVTQTSSAAEFGTAVVWCQFVRVWFHRDT